MLCILKPGAWNERSTVQDQVLTWFMSANLDHIAAISKQSMCVYFHKFLTKELWPLDWYNIQSNSFLLSQKPGFESGDRNWETNKRLMWPNWSKFYRLFHFQYNVISLDSSNEPLKMMECRKKNRNLKKAIKLDFHVSCNSSEMRLVNTSSYTVHVQNCSIWYRLLEGVNVT